MIAFARSRIRDRIGGRFEPRRHAAHAPEPGVPLVPRIRNEMEQRFRHDFSGVRVHSGEDAARSAHALGATAYTTGSHIVFGAAAYAPETARGRGLLAHELAHVVQQRGAQPANVLSERGDRDEHAAHGAVAALRDGRMPPNLGSAGAIVQRQALSDSPSALPQTPIAPSRSQGEIVLESFLERMWEAQSKQQRPFRLTGKVVEGLGYLFPLGIPNLGVTDFPSASDAFRGLRGKVSATIDPMVMSVLDRLPSQEQTLPATGLQPASDPAAPAFPTPAPGTAPEIPSGTPPPSKSDSDVMLDGLQKAFDAFTKTTLGKELVQSGKDFAFSKDGIPFVVWATAGVLTFVAANNPKLPSAPDIKLGDGVTLKIDYSGKATDLPPLLRDLVKAQTEPPGTTETKLSVSLTVTNEGLAELGRFFVMVGEAIAKGVVTVGTVIGRGVRSALPEILAGLGGAAIGATIGGLAGGGIGALIGALAGAAAGVGIALIARFRPRKATT